MRGFALAALAGLVMASSAGAQDYGYPNDDGYQYRTDRDHYRDAAYQPGGEVVIVNGPRRHPERDSVTGAPVQDIALSEAVRFDDLDLATREGAHALRERIKRTAARLCRRLDESYAPSATSAPPCYDDALNDAMAQADEAIAAARDGYRDGDGYRDDSYEDEQ
ncbi:MAG TPA: UrcA family protein [Rhizomicrobium sp.]|jgi:UrcA family protein